MNKKESNQLIKEKSPYLLQHAYNTVNWYPWQEEAFNKAKKEDKPIFLSIGYSTCHWCHVMERESFEDEVVGDLLNKNFISIKVDREERPDIDKIYMKVCQTLTGRGGWPLTIIMTPDKKPFFAGTYFPKENKRGRLGLIEVLNKINEAWNNNREELLSSSNEITKKIKEERRKITKEITDSKIEELIHQSKESLKKKFDEQYGGFSRVPKFPMPHNLMLLLRYWKWSKDDNALNMVETTLDNMYKGGIYDHIGFGFSRYSTDRKWLVPHFEKMLYDNALLTLVYLEGYQVTGKDDYRKIAKEILTYIERDMTSKGGGFYSAEDADSEGEEGKFYIWSPVEIKEILGEEEGTKFCKYYNITTIGNFEGKNIPNLIDQDIDKNKIDEKFSQARKKLFDAREKRVHPYKDDKISTDWNGLMITALAVASRVLKDKKYQRQAEKAVEFIWNNLRNEDGRLLARYREGEANYLAYLDDYSFLIWGLIELYQTSFNSAYLKKALTLNQQLFDYFWDEEQGGFYIYGSDGEQLISRPKEVYDGAIPSGNSVTTLNLLRLAKLTGDIQLYNKAEEQFKFFWSTIEKNPTAYSYFIMALLFAQVGGREVVIVGEKDERVTQEMLREVKKEFTPFTTVLLFNDANQLDLSNLTSKKFDYQKINNQVTAYICKNFSCQAPITKAEKFREEF